MREVAGIDRKTPGVETADRSSDDRPGVGFRGIEPCWRAGWVDSEFSGAIDRNRGGSDQVPIRSGRTANRRHIHPQTAARLQGHRAHFQRGARPGAVARIHQAADGQIADRTIAHQRGPRSHRHGRIRRRTANQKRARAHRRVAAIRARARQRQNARALLLQRARAADHATVRRVVRAVPNQSGVIHDVGRQRADRAIVADLHRAGAVGHRSRKGVRAGQQQRAGAQLAKGASADDRGRNRQRIGAHIDEAVVDA